MTARVTAKNGEYVAEWLDSDGETLAISVSETPTECLANLRWLREFLLELGIQ